MNEYKAMFDVDCGRKDKKTLFSHQYERNNSFKAENDIEAYNRAILDAKEMAKTLYANPSNGCTTVKLNTLQNGKPTSYKMLEAIVQYDHNNDVYYTGLDKEFKEVIFLKQVK